MARGGQLPRGAPPARRGPGVAARRAGRHTNCLINRTADPSWTTRCGLTASPPRRTTHALELAAQFAEQRQKVLAENLANIDTPNYHTQRLDPAAFQTSLRKAWQRARQTAHGG